MTTSHTPIYKCPDIHLNSLTFLMLLSKVKPIIKSFHSAYSLLNLLLNFIHILFIHIYHLFCVYNKKNYKIIFHLSFCFMQKNKVYIWIDYLLKFDGFMCYSILSIKSIIYNWRSCIFRRLKIRLTISITYSISLILYKL